MTIAIVVHGRFYGFDLARALLERGHSVHIFTNYPKWATRRFGLADNVVSGFWMHGVLARLVERTGFDLESFLHRLFGRWAAAQVAKRQWDVILAFSGVAEELLRMPPQPGALRFVTRGSAHIRVQDRLLAEEAARSNASIVRPTPWMIAREEFEYEQADGIVVLSSFARQSFLECDFTDKLFVLPLGVNVERFRPDPAIVLERCRRIRSGAPLRVLFTGALSFQKGLLDYAAIVDGLHGSSFQFRCVGSTPPESRHIVSRLTGQVEFMGHQPESELPDWYSWADLFLFPTIQDGFAVVLSQALASALPVLTTNHCSGSDIIRDDDNGWVMPIRSPQAFIARLRRCDTNREAVAGMVERLYRDFPSRDWSDVAADFESLCRSAAGAFTH